MSEEKRDTKTKPEPGSDALNDLLEELGGSVEDRLVRVEKGVREDSMKSFKKALLDESEKK